MYPTVPSRKEYASTVYTLSDRFEYDRYWVKPIHIAGIYGDTILLDILIRDGHNINDLDQNGYTSILYAIGRHSSKDTIETFFNRGSILTSTFPFTSSMRYTLFDFIRVRIDILDLFMDPNRIYSNYIIDHSDFVTIIYGLININKYALKPIPNIEFSKLLLSKYLEKNYNGLKNTDLENIIDKIITCNCNNYKDRYDILSILGDYHHLIRSLIFRKLIKYIFPSFLKGSYLDTLHGVGNCSDNRLYIYSRIKPILDLVNVIDRYITRRDGRLRFAYRSILKSDNKLNNKIYGSHYSTTKVDIIARRFGRDNNGRTWLHYYMIEFGGTDRLYRFIRSEMDGQNRVYKRFLKKLYKSRSKRLYCYFFSKIESLETHQSI